MKILILVLCVGFLIGCKVEVGDFCINNLDCIGSSGLNLTCDLFQLEGYCIMSFCEVNECFSKVVCVFFLDDILFCMKCCDENEDCWSDYVCVDNYGDFLFCNVEFYFGFLE